VYVFVFVYFSNANVCGSGCRYMCIFAFMCLSARVYIRDCVLVVYFSNVNVESECVYKFV